MKELSLQNISSCMGGETILHSVTLSMDRGERLCLLGPSGCGKTTLLRIVAGLDASHGGKVLFRGRNIKPLPSHERNFGMMFQDFALFPHRNVFQNIAFGLEMKKKTKGEIEHRVAEMLELVGLPMHGKRRISELSGGERQRVALARTLAPAPELIMLDEPLAALDRLLRERLLSDLCTILDKTRITTILVTHDQQEAFAVAHRICVMDRGRVEQVDSPVALYNHPAGRTVADFLGFQNIVNKGISFTDKGEVCIDHEQGRSFFSMPAMERAGHKDNASLLFLPDGGTLVPFNGHDQSQEKFLNNSNHRPRGGVISAKQRSTDTCTNENGQNKIKKNVEAEKIKNRIFGTLEDVFFQGSVVKIRIKTLFGRWFSFDVPARGRLPERGETVELAIDPESIRVIRG
ncbi:ABC-type Fe3+/spermidine/putrescine transport systems, ATPase components [Desulfocicer vacuolatum DSM 3385]|uniref:ABC-type Fe3+/spermidine/putrescine transport systems, ATPase components n=2 Tax=Desulfocicer vacuolatum TaxID=2298 RepID=A0A1W2BFG0_9BACT|nr:ABC-type Fe3+/spermidine/putrescine transport systems, ATPase components [Desulfocicer vacuolatum DSM 3385]